jgi:hypothetical protein
LLTAGEIAVALKTINGKSYYDCFLCKRPFRFGEDVYDGRYIRQWNVEICNDCLRENSDGIEPTAHKDLIELLTGKDIPFSLNKWARVNIPVR